MPTQDMKGRKVANTYNELQLKARRRQSDSKWRASMAHCFETLMHVIPMSKRAHKKQSKAIILKETALHIDFLENTVVSMLQEKAEKQGIKNVGSWCAKKVIQLQENFVVSQKCQAKINQKMRNRSKNTTNLTKTAELSVDKTTTANVESQLFTPVKNKAVADYDNGGSGFTPIKLPSSWYLEQTPPKVRPSLVSCQTLFPSLTGDESTYLDCETSDDRVTCSELLCNEVFGALDEDGKIIIKRNQTTPKLQWQPKKQEAIRKKYDKNNNGLVISPIFTSFKKVDQKDGKEFMKCRRSLNLSEVESPRNSNDRITIEVIRGSNMSSNQPDLRLVSLDPELKEYDVVTKSADLQSYNAHDVGPLLQGYNDLESKNWLSFDPDDGDGKPLKNTTSLMAEHSPLLSQTLSSNSDVEDLSLSWSVDDTGDESRVDSQSDPIEDLYMECKSCDSILSHRDERRKYKQPEYLGQYSPLFGHGIGQLLNL